MIENCRFLYDQIKKNLPKNFIVANNQHQYNTRRKKLDVPIVKVNYYGSLSFSKMSLIDIYLN